MNHCDSANDAGLAFDEVFQRLYRYLIDSEFPRKAKDRYLAWLDRPSTHLITGIGDHLRVYSEFPSSKNDDELNNLPKLWYWFVGSRGLLHELNRRPRFASVVSSRQSHRSEDRRRWFRKFLHAAQAIARADDWWLLFPSIATGPLSDHVARRCNVRSIQCSTVPWPLLLERLLQLESHLIDLSSEHLQVRCLITPSLSEDPDQGCFNITSKLSQSTSTKDKICDRLSVHLPQRLHVIDIREGGNMDQLIAERLQATPQQASSIRIYRLLNEKTTPQQPHLENGAIDWLILEPQTPLPANTVGKDRVDFTTYNPVFTPRGLPRFDHTDPASPWPYLTHCTRAKFFEWSDTSLTAEWDRWLLNGLPEAASPWETLLQIARSQRLLSFSEMTREKIATISFSAVPLLELLSRRTYRSHLRRWDWEPYGVCIHQTALQAVGAREVIYGDEATWRSLSHQDRPWFQPRFSRSGKLDWQEELEWRILGDLRLRKVPWETIFFFVPTLREAESLSRIAPWPVAVVGEGLGKGRA